jgi:cytochrome oxidase Cu insertion factor (SCO1/SenC/PrrC family)/cytochrome c2
MTAITGGRRKAPSDLNFQEKQMQRRLLSTPYLSTIAAVAVVVVSTSAAVFLPGSHSQPLSPISASAAAAAAPQDSEPVAEGKKQAAREATPGTASATPSNETRTNNRWGASYIPNLPVIDQNGRTLHFYDDVIKDKIVVISFIYTSCQDLCPLTTARLAQLEDKLDGAVGRDIFFVSMSVDPENDTPERLKAFADAFDVGPGWLFLTGKLADIRAINYKFGDRSDRGLSDHRNEIILGNDSIGDWQRASAFGDLGDLANSVRQMNPKWLNEAHLPQREEPVEGKKVTLVDDPGQMMFKRVCAPCHTIGVGDRVGPDLRDVSARRDHAWLINFIRNPKKAFRENDPTALALATRFPGVRMPILGLTESDAADVLDYLDRQSARIVDGAPGTAPQTSHHHH